MSEPAARGKCGAPGFRRIRVFRRLLPTDCGLHRPWRPAHTVTRRRAYAVERYRRLCRTASRHLGCPGSTRCVADPFFRLPGAGDEIVETDGSSLFRDGLIIKLAPEGDSQRLRLAAGATRPRPEPESPLPGPAAHVGQPERATQDRVIALFRDELHYRYLGDWTDRDGNSNIEEGMLDGLPDPERLHARADQPRPSTSCAPKPTTTAAASTETTGRLQACSATACR